MLRESRDRYLCCLRDAVWIGLRPCLHHSNFFMRVLRLARGDLTRWTSEAIATSANAGLCGNRAPHYWRFRCRAPTEPPPFTQLKGCGGVQYANVDGAVHGAAGPALHAALRTIAARRGRRLPYYLNPDEPWRGALFPASTDSVTACLTGTALCTPAFGALRDHGATTVVHAVAPDGRHPTGPPGAAAALLRATYAAVISEACNAGVSSVAMPSIGCGVNCWPPEVAAAAALDAATEWLRGGLAPRAGNHAGSQLGRVDFVLAADATFAAWQARSLEELGTPAPASAPDCVEWRST